MTTATARVKVGEEPLTLENLSEFEDQNVLDQVNEAIQDMNKALDGVPEGTGVITLKIGIAKFRGDSRRDVACKIETAIKATVEKHERQGLPQGKGGLVVERFEQQTLPIIASIGGRAS